MFELALSSNWKKLQSIKRLFVLLTFEYFCKLLVNTRSNDFMKNKPKSLPSKEEVFKNWRIILSISSEFLLSKIQQGRALEIRQFFFFSLGA